MRTNPIIYLSITLTILFTVAGQLFVKYGMMQVGSSSLQASRLTKHLLTTLTNPFVFFGFFCAFIAALTWTVAISRAQLSFAYPFVGLGIVLTLVFSSLLFGDKVSSQRWMGVALVCLGLIVVARSK